MQKKKKSGPNRIFFIYIWALKINIYRRGCSFFLPVHTHRCVQQVKTLMLAAHAASPINKTTYMVQIRPLKDWRLFHSQGWHATWSAQPNLIFTPPSLLPSFTAPPLSGTVSPIEIIFHYRCHHPSSSFSLPHDIQSRAGYWHFQFFKTICPPRLWYFPLTKDQLLMTSPRSFILKC